MTIRPLQPQDVDAVVALSLRAWAPVFASLERAMPRALYEHFFPDWRVTQAKAVEAVCADAAQHVCVAAENGTAAGFVAVRLHADDAMGEIYMVAVDPAHQGKGIGTALTEFALEWMKQQGMSVAMVETGADPGHAPARRTYERAGFTLLPAARYFKLL